MILKFSFCLKKNSDYSERRRLDVFDAFFSP